MNRWKRDSETCARERKRERDISWTGTPESETESLGNFLASKSEAQ